MADGIYFAMNAHSQRDTSYRGYLLITNLRITLLPFHKTDIIYTPFGKESVSIDTELPSTASVLSVEIFWPLQLIRFTKIGLLMEFEKFKFTGPAVGFGKISNATELA
jgi:hypothetical protein